MSLEKKPEIHNSISELTENIVSPKNTEDLVLANKIVEKAWIEIETAKLLANIETSSWLDAFRNELENNNNKESFSLLTDEKIEVAFNVIRNQIKESVQTNIHSLHNELNISTFIFEEPVNNIQAIKYSSLSMWKLVSWLSKWILNTPRDLGLWISWKSTYKTQLPSDRII